MGEDMALLDWLRDSDPALRWQVERDLADAPESTWQTTRARVAQEGFGARLLAHQDADGQWAGGAYFPKDGVPGDGEFETEGQPWTATTWTLNVLREWGVEASALEGTAQKLAANSRWEYENLPYWDGEVDCCINAFTLANGAWLGAEVSGIAAWLVEHQQSEGGWNCQWVEGSTRSSFHSTLNTLKGVLWYEMVTGGSPGLRAARQAGQEYLLERQLMYRLTTGERVGPWVGHFTYPFRWVYSALHAADYFRAASRHDGLPPDPRMADAIDLIRRARQDDGRWLQGEPIPGQVWFDVDVPAGQPSKWLTLSGSRVLRWWDSAG